MSDPLSSPRQVFFSPQSSEKQRIFCEIVGQALAMGEYLSPQLLRILVRSTGISLPERKALLDPFLAWARQMHISDAFVGNVAIALSDREEEVLCYCCHRYCERTSADLVGGGPTGELYWCGCAPPDRLCGARDE